MLSSEKQDPLLGYNDHILFLPAKAFYSSSFNPVTKPNVMGYDLAETSLLIELKAYRRVGANVREAFFIS